MIFGKACYEIDSPAGPWNKKADMPQGQNCQTAAAGPDGKIYVIGGIKPSAGATYLNIVQCFNPNNGTWSQVQPLNSPRFSAAAAAAGGKIYIFGGMDDQANILTSVEEYDPATNKWTVLNEPMPTPRYNLAAVTGSNGRIYVVGGMYQCSAVDAVEEFDPATKLWQVMTPMPTARYGVAAAATTDGRIFVLGGWKKVASTVSATGVIEQGVLPIV
jgi:N-acetylneuraminic acid mutarotase